jgi:hypothetical protein
MKQIYLIIRDRILHGFTGEILKKTELFLLFILFSSFVFGQAGTLKGKVLEKETGEPIPFVNIILVIDSIPYAGGTSNFDGNYCIKPVHPGTYTLKATYVGFATRLIKGIIINANQIRFFDFELESNQEILPEIVVTSYYVPLINKDQTVSGGQITSYGIKKMPNRSVNACASTVGGVFSSNGEQGNIRGSRSDQTVMFIDGIKVLGSSNLPACAIEQVAVYIGGIPAEYENGNGNWEIVNVIVPGSKSKNGYENSPSGKNDEPDEQYKPKLLTAGEINDFSKWELWKDISKTELYSSQSYWNIRPENRYCVQVMNESSFPVVNAQVKLVDDQDEVIWTARTDNTGKAELWSGLFQDSISEEMKYSILIESGNVIKEIRNAKKFHQGVNSVRLNTPCIIGKDVDILFTVDATGSMSDEIEFLKEELKELIRTFSEKKPNLNIRTGSVFYRCFGNSYVTKSSEFTNKIDKTVDFINQQYAGEGGNEAVEEAIRVSVDKMNWNADAYSKIIFLILDEPPASSNEINKTIHKAIESASRQGIRIIPVVGSGEGYGSEKSLEYLMRSLAIATNGTYVFLTDDSGVGETHTKPSIDDYKVELLNDLIARLLVQYTYTEDCSQALEPEITTDTIYSEITDSVNEVQFKESTDLTIDSASIKDSLIGIQEQLNDFPQIKAFPNPSRGTFTIEHHRSIEEIFVVDITGKVLQRIEDVEKNLMKVDLSDFPNGMYFLKFANVDHWEYCKIILSH